MGSCGKILSKKGAHLYRFVFLAAQEVLWSACNWRNDIETLGPNKMDSVQAKKDLEAAVKSLEHWLSPPLVSGKVIGPDDEVDWSRIRRIERVDIQGQLRAARSGVFSAVGFSEKSAHEVVLRLGKATGKAASVVAKNKGATLRNLLGPTSVLRTKIQGLGAIPEADANKLEAECRWEAENAWEKANSNDGGETVDNRANVVPSEIADNKDQQPALTGVAPRNAWSLQQYEASGTDTYHKPVKIHAKWGAMEATERAEICPDSPNKITKAAIVKGIKRARDLRDGKPAKPKAKRKRAVKKR